MSYEHGTLNYNLPQTGAGDTRDWFDTNEPFRVIDETLHSATQTAGQATRDITSIREDISKLENADTSMTGRINAIDGRVSTNELKIQRLENATANTKQDLMDAICSIEEASATAAYPHNTGDFFWYNDTLYKAISNIASGQQIVPDTNCRTTNITTELLAGGGGGGAEIDDTVVSATKVWSSYKTNEEITNASAVKVGDTRYYSGKIQYYDGSAWQDASIGGGNMPELDYTTPLHTLVNGTSYRATSDCYVVGNLNIKGTSGTPSATLTINSNVVYCISATDQFISATSVPVFLKVRSGDVILMSGDNGGTLKIYAEA